MLGHERDMQEKGLMQGKRAVLWAVALLLGLNALLPYQPFPSIDDFAYAPLTELWRNPALYPGDVQIHTFAMHAWAYALAYCGAKASIGLAPGFWVLTVALAVASGLALFAILRRLGGGLPEFLLVLASPCLLTILGIGRAEYGGFIAPLFHHQGVSLCLVAWSFALLLGRRMVWAGIVLGLAAYAQPVSALHGAFATGLAVLAMGGPWMRRGLILAGTAMATALPLAVVVLASRVVTDAPPAALSAAELVDKAYLFRAPHHYVLDWPAIRLGWTWMAIGALSLAAIRHHPLARPMAGIMTGFAVLLLTATLGHFVWQSHFLPLYILDVTRTTSLGFALASVLFAAAFRDHWHGDGSRSLWRHLCFWIAAGLMLELLAGYGTVLSWSVAIAAILAMVFRRYAAPVVAFTAFFGLFLFAASAPQRAQPRTLPADEAAFYSWIRKETPADALFVTPPSMDGFRLYARRGIYADFKMFSVAQPAQAWLTRERLQQVARPDAHERALEGWDGIRQWDKAYAHHTDCAGIAALLDETQADYLVRPGSSPDCGQAVIRVFQNPAYAIYRPREGR